MAQPEENESVLQFGVVGVIYQQRTLVREDGSSVFKGDLALAKIDLRLARIPLELDGHGWMIVRMLYLRRNAATVCGGNVPRSKERPCRDSSLQ